MSSAFGLFRRIRAWWNLPYLTAKAAESKRGTVPRDQAEAANKAARETVRASGFKIKGARLYSEGGAS